MTPEEVVQLQNFIRENVYISDQIYNYILDITNKTRNHEYLTAGLSTRGSLAIMYTAKANAFFKGRDFVIPEDIKELAEYVIPHRVLFKEEYGEISKKEIIKSLIEEIPLPV